MATSKTQRIGILVIAVVMIIGTVFSFFAIILQNSNAQIDAERQSAQQEELQKEYEKYNDEVVAYQEEVSKENEEIEKKYASLIKEYEDRPDGFDNSKITELEKKDLKKGDGEEVKDIDSVRAYYIGWNADGEVFDSSIGEGGTMQPPIAVVGTIQGWQDGVMGMNIGGVRELSIPSELAYGDQEVGDDIPANSSLKFVVVALPASKIKEPEMSEKLRELLDQVAPNMGM